jgi:hypothetical protein
MNRLKATNTAFALLCVTIAVVITACPSSKTATGKLTGWVDDTEGNMLPLVEVSVTGEEKTYTDGHGLFNLEQVKAGEEVLVAFALEGYAPHSQVVEIPEDGIASIEATLVRLDEEKNLVSGSGTADDGDGNALTVDAGDLDDGQGKGISGSLGIHISALNPTVPWDLQAAPGSFEASVSGGTPQLEVFAMANFTVENASGPVWLSAGAQAGLSLRLPAGTDFEVGDTIPLWYFDVSAGLWIHGGTGTVQAGGTGGLVCVGDVAFFGWWCCGVTIAEGHCITGQVYDQEGLPLEHALVRAVGQDYHGIGWVLSQVDGTYTITVKPESEVRLDLIPAGAYYVADTLDVSTGAAGACTEDQDLAIDFDACISGYVTEDDEVTPIEAETVYSSTGGVAVTDVTGYFCMPAPGDTYVAVYVVGRPPKVVETPETGSCGAGTCAEVMLSVDYPEDGDLVGYIVGTHRTHEFLGTPLWSDLTSTALLYSGFDGEQFNLYDFGAIEDSYEVHSVQLTPSFDLAFYLAFGAFLPEEHAFSLLFGLDFGLNGLFENDLVPVKADDPEGGRIGALDAGSPGLLTNGTVSIDMVRPLDYYLPGFQGDGSLGDLGYALLEPWMGGLFRQEGFVAWEGFAQGDTLTYSWPGGVDLGAFAVAAGIPGSFELTAPTDLRNLFSADALLNGVTLQWDVTNPGDLVTVVIETLLVESAEASVELGVLVLHLVDDGEYVIPADVLAQMPHTGAKISVELQTNYMFAMRQSVQTAQVPLVRATGNGEVVLLVGTEPSMAFSVDAQVIFDK